MMNQKGITLIALIITIIVMLILAAVTISLAVGQDGLFGRAEEAVERSAAAAANERVSLAIGEATAFFHAERAMGSTPPNATELATRIAANINGSDVDATATVNGDDVEVTRTVGTTTTTRTIEITVGGNSVEVESGDPF